MRRLSPWTFQGTVRLVGQVIGLNLVKNVKNGFYCCYIKYLTVIVGVEGMPWPKTRATVNMHSWDKHIYFGH